MVGVISFVGVAVGVKVGVGVGVLSFEINGMYIDGGCGVPSWPVGSPGSKIATSGVAVDVADRCGVSVAWFVIGDEVASESIAASAVKLFIRKVVQTSRPLSNGIRRGLISAKFFAMEAAYECIGVLDRDQIG